LDELHRLLRSRVAASPLYDEGAFARKMEAAFRTMWQHWCEASKETGNALGLEVSPGSSARASEVIE